MTVTEDFLLAPPPRTEILVLSPSGFEIAMQRGEDGKFYTGMAQHRVTITDDMVKRAADAAWYGSYHGEEDRAVKYAAARRILQAAHGDAA